MSERFWENVSEFFKILDLDSDSMLDSDEAKIGLSICFDAVHQVDRQHNNSVDIYPQSFNDPVHKLTDEQAKSDAIQKQVDWLFAATSHEDHSPISYQHFKECYNKLLQSAYEEEVLYIDMQRGMKSLQQNDQHNKMHQLFITLNQILNSIKSQSNSHILIKQFLNKAFECITCANTIQLPPNKHSQSKRIVEPFLQQIDSQQNVSDAAIKSTYKKLLLVPVSASLLNSQLQSAKQEMTITLMLFFYHVKFGPSKLLIS